MVAGGRGRFCGTSAACAKSLLSRRAPAATGAAIDPQRRYATLAVLVVKVTFTPA
jgi:hypothetical protein